MQIDHISSAEKLWENPPLQAGSTQFTRKKKTTGPAAHPDLAETGDVFSTTAKEIMQGGQETEAHQANANANGEAQVDKLQPWSKLMDEMQPIRLVNMDQNYSK